MPDQVQLRGGTAADNNAFTGANREVTVDTTNKTLRVHDGVAAGGHPLIQGTASSTADADTIALRDAWGRLQVADPVDDSDVVNKGSMDAAIVGSLPESVIIVDSKGPTTNGGTFTSGAWRTRDLNLIRNVANKPDWISLASNVLTIQPGIYDLHALAPANQVNQHAARWRRTTATAATILSGSRKRSSDSTSTGMTVSGVVGRFVVTEADVAFELQHYCETTKTTTGFGIASVSIGVEADVDGAENVFSTVTITRIGDAP